MHPTKELFYKLIKPTCVGFVCVAEAVRCGESFDGTETDPIKLMNPEGGSPVVATAVHSSRVRDFFDALNTFIH